MINLGRMSYAGKVHELFYPVVNVGNFCSISDDVTFMGDCQHPPVRNPLCVSSFPFKEMGWGDYTPSRGVLGGGGRGPITIGHDVWIGNGAMIMDGVEIGIGAIVGARAVVRHDVPPYAVVVGNPAIITHYRFDGLTITRLLAIPWWYWDDKRIKDAIPYMKDVNQFIQRFSTQEAGK